MKFNHSLSRAARHTASVGLLLISVFAFTGCWEERTTIEVNPAGGGRIEQTLLISERAVIGMSDDGAVSAAIPVGKDQLEEALGDLLENLVIEVEDRADGSRRIAWSGNFASTEAFFTSAYVTESLGLRIEREGENGVAFGWNFDNRSEGLSPEIGLNQQYGLVQGLYRRLIIRSGEASVVDWSFDLRDRAGLERSREWLDATAGKVRQVVTGEALGFDWERVAAPASADAVTSSANRGDSSAAEVSPGLQVTPHSMNWRRSRNLENPDHDQSALEIWFSLQVGDETPEAYYPIVIETARDDTGQDLVRPSARNTGNPQAVRDNLRVIAWLNAPAPEATAVHGLTGYFPLLMSSQTETVIVDDLTTGASSTGIEALDALGFKLTQVSGNRIQFTSKAESSAFKNITVLAPSGDRIESRGSSSGGRSNHWSMTYRFADPIPEGASLEITLRISETIINVPFAIEELALP